MGKKPLSTVISLDVMGGDNAPYSVLAGANRYAKSNKEVKFLLFGDENLINSELAKYPHLSKVCDIINSPNVINSDERASVALRKGKKSSMRMAIDSVTNKKADAVISAGNTGALMAMSKLSMRTLPGIDRPAITSILPTIRGRSVMLDLGANIDCSVDNLVQFAVMGNAFAKVVLGLDNPTVGLLNVGSEEMKGSEIVRAAAEELREGDYPINFVGYIEGDDIAKGTVDVVVTDGFTGNIALKTAEGTAKICVDRIRSSFKRNPLAMLGGLLARWSLKKSFKNLDPRMHNGAMFLGLNGIAVKSHGSADEVSFANAISVAYKLAYRNINQQIISELYIEEDEYLEEEVD